MKKSLSGLAVAGLVVGGLAIGSLTLASPANAGCQAAWFGIGFGERCDYPIQPDGWFRRCDAGGAFGFGGRNCYMVDIRNLGPNAPYIP